MIKEIYNKDYTYLIDLNIEFFNFFINLLDLNKTKIIYESSFILPNEKNDAIIELCKQNSADVYFSGKAAEKYLDYSKFKRKNIKIELQNCIDIKYKQMGSDWVPKLSILDTLFMIGIDGCKNILKNINRGDSNDQ